MGSSGFIASPPPHPFAEILEPPLMLPGAKLNFKASALTSFRWPFCFRGLYPTSSLFYAYKLNIANNSHLSRSRVDIGDRHETEVINIKNCHGGLGEFFVDF